MATIDVLRKAAQEATAHLGEMRQALVAAEAAERSALDAHDPRDTSAKALAPVEAARARVASARHHLEKAIAFERASSTALGVELRRLAREEFDAMADRFGMRGWEKGNAERIETYLRAQDQARRLLRDLLDDVDRWNEPAPDMYAVAGRTGYLEEVPVRASGGAIAEFLKGHSHEPPVEIRGVRAVFLPADHPDHRVALSWGRKLLRRVTQRATAHLEDGTEIEPSVLFKMLERTLARCKPANTPAGTTSGDAFLLGEEEWLAAQSALDAWSSERPDKMRDERDSAGRLVDQRRMVIDRKAG